MRQFFTSERNVMLAVILNAAIIFLLYFPELSDNPLLLIPDDLLILFFLFEAVYKIKLLKPKGYFADNWNRFDFLIVLISLPTLLELFIPVPKTSLALLFRVFRLTRLLRFFKFIPHLAKIMEGLGRAMKASLFVLMALFFLNFVLALFTCHFFGQIAPEFFGNPLISSFSIFQMFTVEGWNEIPAIIAERTENPVLGGVSRFYFVLVVLIGGIFGMSLANAIFVDEMTVDNNNALELKIDELQRQILEMSELFRQKNGGVGGNE
jgi:voltage-gated sodium channel